jgi:hypothetical protein
VQDSNLRPPACKAAPAPATTSDVRPQTAAIATLFGRARVADPVATRVDPRAFGPGLGHGAGGRSWRVGNRRGTEGTKPPDRPARQRTTSRSRRKLLRRAQRWTRNPRRIAGAADGQPARPGADGGQVVLAVSSTARPNASRSRTPSNGPARSPTRRAGQLRPRGPLKRSPRHHALPLLVRSGTQETTPPDSSSCLKAEVAGTPRRRRRPQRAAASGRPRRRLRAKRGRKIRSSRCTRSSSAAPFRGLPRPRHGVSRDAPFRPPPPAAARR